MIQNTTTITDSVRISKDILEKIKIISKLKGQTISGYINVNLSKHVDKDWFKFQNKHEKKNSI
jgi:predicted DNA-binding protein